MNKLHWRGEEVRAKVERAAKIGIDTTMAACVVEAKTNHAYRNVTGSAEGSVQFRPAERIGEIIVGRWGSFSVEYFLWLEIGTARTGDGFPSLRPAADRIYPELAGHIRAAM